MNVGISIVNYKTAELTIECLRSLSHDRKKTNISVIVVDNDSQDGSFYKLSAAVMSQGWDDWVTIIASAENGGFAYGNNVAIRSFLKQKMPPDFIYLLNPDAFIRTGAVDILADFLEQHPKVGIVGSRIENDDGTPQLSSFKFHTAMTELDRGFSLAVMSKMLAPWVDSHTIVDQAEQTDWVSGASLMARREVFEQVGLLDEAYFMYFEETDFCLQANKAGWECWYVPESKVVHYVGQSSGITSEAMVKRMPSYWFDSRRRYFLKNYGVIHAFFADLFWLKGFASWRLRNLIQKKPHNHPPHLLKDSFMHSVLVRGFKTQPVKNK